MIQKVESKRPYHLEKKLILLKKKSPQLFIFLAEGPRQFSSSTNDSKFPIIPQSNVHD